LESISSILLESERNPAPFRNTLIPTLILRKKYTSKIMARCFDEGDEGRRTGEEEQESEQRYRKKEGTDATMVNKNPWWMVCNIAGISMIFVCTLFFIVMKRLVLFIGVLV
jgi:hypothetical protein